MQLIYSKMNLVPSLEQKMSIKFCIPYSNQKTSFARGNLNKHPEAYSIVEFSWIHPVTTLADSFVDISLFEIVSYMLNKTMMRGISYFRA